MLISDKLQRFESILTLQGKPNHTTYGHSRSPTWQPFTSAHRSRHRRIPPKDTLLTYLRTVASQPLSACSQSLPCEAWTSIQYGTLRFQLRDLAGYVGSPSPTNTAC